MFQRFKCWQTWCALGLPLLLVACGIRGPLYLRTPSRPAVFIPAKPQDAWPDVAATPAPANAPPSANTPVPVSQEPGSSSSDKSSFSSVKEQ